MDKNRLKISVALCTYNGERFLQEQLDSIVNQTKKIDQIVLSDDNSTDNTIELLMAFKEKYENEIEITIIQNNPGLGVVKNFEGAISKCYGDIIFTSDQDDIWMVEKVEKIVACFNSCDTLLVFSNAELVDSKSNLMNHRLWTSVKYFHGINHRQKTNKFFYGNYVTGATMAFRKELVSIAYPFPVIDNLLHDFWLAFIANSISEIYSLNECLIHYRQHDANVAGCSVDKKSLGNKMSTRKNDLKKLLKLIVDLLTTFNKYDISLSRDDYIYYSKVMLYYNDLFNLLNNINLLCLVKFVVQNKLSYSKYFINVSVSCLFLYFQDVTLYFFHNHDKFKEKNND